MSHDGPRPGWTGTIFITTIATIVMALLAFAMSGYRDGRVTRGGAHSVAYSAISSDDTGRTVRD